MKRRAVACISFAISLSVLIVIEWSVFPTDWSWRAFAAFCAFTFGFIEITGVVVDMRREEMDSGSARLLIGAALFLTGLYLASTSPGGGRLVAAGLILSLSGWATA